MAQAENTQASTFLKKRICVENEIVTFRLLSRELSMHVNEAKNELAKFYERSLESANPVFATFLLSGEITAEPTSTQEESQTSSPTKVIHRSFTRHRIMLATQNELEEAKCQFTSITSTHIYSLSPDVIKDSSLLTTNCDAVRQKDGINGVEQTRKLGVTMALDIKWSGPTNKAKGKENVVNPTSLKADPSAGNDAQKKHVAIKKDPAPAATKKLAPSPTEPTLVGKQVTVKSEETKKSGVLDWSKGKTKVATPTVPEVKPEPKISRKSKSEANLQVDKSAFKANLKRSSPPSEADEHIDEPRNVKAKLEPTKVDLLSASRPLPSKNDAATSRVQKGRVVSDDEEEEEMPVPKAPSRPTAKKRKSVRISDDDEEEEEEPPRKRGVVRGHDIAAKRKEASLRAMMDIDDDDEDGAETPFPDLSEEEEELSAPEHVPLKQPKAAPKEKKQGIDVSNKPRKKRAAVHIGENGKKMKRVVKTKQEKNAKGYLVSVDYSSYEEDEGFDDEASHADNTKAKSRTSTKQKGKVSEEDRTINSKSKSTAKDEPSKPKKMLQKKGSLSGKGSNLMSYFGKS